MHPASCFNKIAFVSLVCTITSGTVEKENNVKH